MDLTAPPDAEAATVGYLNTELAALGDAARASTRVPNPRPARFVRASLTGTTPRSIAHTDAQVTIECWDTDSAAAAELARLVYALMCAMDTPDGHVPQGPDGWVGGPVYLEDPTAGEPRYVMTPIVRARVQTLTGGTP
ncbi:hypothetical protein [Cellulomonas hominis]|uniref:hypothetical protein n=1 Tax=Cellulomonas hominis TaxID=156981 RepID=UPI0014443F22|nr:hypothetical protein [Cellulomonas hominis]NKY08944.1 hypothetical protein [Cellulomonas hominis]